MRQRQPHRAELQQAGSAGVEDPPGGVDVRYGIAVQKQSTVLEIIGERNERDARGQLGHKRSLTIPIMSGLGFRRLGAGSPAHSRWVNSRKTWKRASISSRVSDCRRSVPKRSTANDPITPP